MRTLHLSAGAAFVVAFLLTGQYMDYLDVRSGAFGETTRMMFRSRHIYVLLGKSSRQTKAARLHAREPRGLVTPARFRAAKLLRVTG